MLIDIFSCEDCIEEITVETYSHPVMHSTFKVDSTMKDIIVNLNKKRLHTKFCCGGHRNSNLIYIAFNTYAIDDYASSPGNNWKTAINFLLERGWGYNSRTGVLSIISSSLRDRVERRNELSEFVNLV